MEQRKCIRCDKPFEGRVDKIFCSVYCKSDYHYQNKKEESQTVFKSIDLQLKRNHRLLKHFNTAGKSTIRAEKLLSAGFDPAYFTHCWKNRKDQIYLFCYDVGYLKVADDKCTKYVLVDWQEYMTPIISKTHH